MENKYLLIKHYKGQTNESEKLIVESWLKESGLNQLEYKKIIQIWENATLLKELELINIKDEWDDLVYLYNKRSLPLRKLKINYRITATLLVIISLSFFMYRYVYLTRTNEIINNSSGEVLEINLSDGSQIALNYKSKLIYPKKFKNTKREVLITGNGYFNITKDKTRPFRVFTQNGKVEVLGTSFNVISKPSYTSVAVEDGRVKLISQNNHSQAILEPGYIGELEGGELSKSVNANENYLSWKTGVFVFKDSNLIDVFKDLQTKYHFQFKFDDEGLKERRLTASFNKESLNEIFTIVEIGCQVKIVKESGILIIR